jgi:hypothetical protein
MEQLARDYQMKCIIYWQPKIGRRLVKPPPEKVSTKFYDSYLVKNKQQNTHFLENSMGPIHEQEITCGCSIANYQFQAVTTQNGQGYGLSLFEQSFGTALAIHAFPAI